MCSKCKNKLLKKTFCKKAKSISVSSDQGIMKTKWAILINFLARVVFPISMRN